MHSKPFVLSRSSQTVSPSKASTLADLFMSSRTPMTKEPRSTWSTSVLTDLGEPLPSVALFKPLSKECGSASKVWWSPADISRINTTWKQHPASAGCFFIHTLCLYHIRRTLINERSKIQEIDIPRETFADISKDIKLLRIPNQGWIEGCGQLLPPTRCWFCGKKSTQIHGRKTFSGGSKTWFMEQQKWHRLC